MSGSYLGPEHSNLEIEETLNNCSAIYDKYDDENLIKITAAYCQKVRPLVGFRAEWNLVLVHSAVDQLLLIQDQIKMQKNLNLKVKFRESFRPFAPSILRDDISDWFDIKSESPYMLLVSNIKKTKIINMTDDEKNFLV